MAALVAGVQYGLTSQDNFNENKSLIFVKLTDSALRAIEQYLRNRNKCSQTPTIQFLGNEGHLSFPNGQSPRSRSAFKFSLSSNSDIEGPQGSFECIRHTGQRCLDSVGSLPCKMRVQANDDVYETTRSRMQAAEKQQKENCTREIDLEKAIGRRLKTRNNKVVNGVMGRRAPPATTAPPPPPHTKPQGNNHAQKPGNPELMKRPIRDRVIHLLAVRPYKKPELFLALNREGLREKDRHQLNNTLMSVTNSRDNTFHLMRHIWNEVQEDWPFYTEQDRQLLKRRKPENLTPPGSSDSQSPSSVHPGSPPSASEPAKRPGYVDGADGLPTKRQRISHYKRPGGPPPLLGGVARGLPHPSPPTPPQDTSPPNKYPTSPPPPSKYPCSPPPHKYPTSPPPHKYPTSPPPPIKHPPQELPKYLLDYTTIKDKDQRRKYKEDFNANYSEYKKLHSLVEHVSKKFTVLQEQLKKEERGSSGWLRIKEQILKEYEEDNKNSRHQDAKRRFQYLHDKLSHIKQLVLDYDAKEYT